MKTSKDNLRCPGCGEIHQADQPKHAPTPSPSEVTYRPAWGPPASALPPMYPLPVRREHVRIVQYGTGFRVERIDLENNWVAASTTIETAELARSMVDATFRFEDPQVPATQAFVMPSMAIRENFRVVAVALTNGRPNDAGGFVIERHIAEGQWVPISHRYPTADAALFALEQSLPAPPFDRSRL